MKRKIYKTQFNIWICLILAILFFQWVGVDIAILYAIIQLMRDNNPNNRWK